MKLFDLHTDTATHLFYRKIPFNSKELSASTNGLDSFAEVNRVFAVFTSTHLSNEAAWHAFWGMREHLLDELDRYRPAITPFLSVEDARILNGNLSRIDDLYRAGVAIVTPLWKDKTVIGGAFDTNVGLSPFGRAAIKRMQEIGIIIDASHASDASFSEIAEISAEAGHPFIATHSNSRTVHPHPRNVTDAQFKAIQRAGGIVGLSFCPDHLSAERATALDLLRHLDHYLSLGGDDTVAIGTDFDGITSTPEGLAENRDLLALSEDMARAGYSDTLIEKFFYKNAEDFFGKHNIKNLRRQEEL